MNMNVDNWQLKDSCDNTQFYYQSKLNADMNKELELCDTVNSVDL